MNDPSSPTSNTFEGGNKLYHAMVMKCVAYRHGNRVGDIDVEQISELMADPETFIWLGLREPNDALLNKIQAEFGLHELAIEDARNPHQRPKMEAYGNTLFVVLRTAQLYRNALQFGETHIFIGARFIVTIRHGTPLSFSKVRERCESMPQTLAKGPGFPLYALMDYIVDNCMDAVERLEERYAQLEDGIFKHHFNQETLEHFYALKRELLQMRTAVTPVRDICNDLMHFHSDLIPQDIQFYFRDISDHARRIEQSIDGMREMLTAAMQVYLALVTVGQNEIVKRLAGWGAILALPTMVFSLYGMNFKHMPEMGWEYSYPALLGALFVACMGLYWRLKREGWL